MLFKVATDASLGPVYLFYLLKTNKKICKSDCLPKKLKKRKYQTQVEEMGTWRGLYSYFFILFPLNQKLSSLQICRKEGCDGDSFSYLRELGPQHEPMWGFPSGSDGKESACNARDLGLIPGWGRSPEEGNGNPLQYSCLENPMDRGAWWAAVHGVTKSWTRLSG